MPRNPWNRIFNRKKDEKQDDKASPVSNNVILLAPETQEDRNTGLTANPAVASNPVTAEGEPEQVSPSDASTSSAGMGADDEDYRGLFTFVKKGRDEAGMVDIVALHGLDGHYYKSWTTSSVKGGEVNWLKDMLPRRIKNARVMSFGYNANVQFSKSTSGIGDFVEGLLADLMSCRTSNQEKSRPIIFICHSLGGIVFKQALVRARERDRFTDLLKHIQGVAFFGTPHAGTSFADFGKVLASISKVSTLGVNTNTNVVNDLRKNSKALYNITQSFVDRSKALRILTFYETEKMDYLSFEAVSRISAVLNLPNETVVPLDVNHVTMCKFSDSGAGKRTFNRVCGHLEEMVIELREDEVPHAASFISDTKVQNLRGPHHKNHESYRNRNPDPIALISQQNLTSSPEGQNEPRLSEAARNCLRSLAFPQMDNRAKDVTIAADKTCNWLLKHTKFVDWASSHQGLLWVQGKPGSGKSTLLRYLLDNFESVPGVHDRDLVLSFFFHARGSELQRTPLGLFRSLLHQLLRQIPEAVEGLLPTFKIWWNTKKQPDQEYDWRLLELQQGIERSLRETLKTRPVWLLIDALDECGKDNARQMVKFLKELLQTLRLATSRFRVCFTCRHYPKLDMDMDFISLESENGDDISTWVMAKLPNPHFSSVSASIISRASGVFMWAHIVASRIWDLKLDGATYSEMMEAVNAIPQGLDALYLDLIQSINKTEDNKKKWDSIKLILWIRFATRPLSVDELSWVMVINADCSYKSVEECRNQKGIPDSTQIRSKVLDLGRGLVEITDDRVVQFIHQSVSDFFLDHGLSALDTGLTSNDAIMEMANLQLFRICVSYLKMDDICRYKGGLDGEFPLLQYATTSWVRHMSKSGTNSILQEGSWKAFAFSSNPFLQQWVRVYNIIDPLLRHWHPKGINLLHILSKYGVTGLLRAILDKSTIFAAAKDSQDQEGRTPLWYAAEGGHDDIVKLLLGYGANAKLEDCQNRTPLALAAMLEHKTVVEIFLHHGQSRNVEWTDSAGQSLLWYAAGEVGLAGIEKQEWEWKLRNAKWTTAFAVLRLLIDEETERQWLDRQDSQGMTLLASSAKNYSIVVSRILLKRGAIVDLADNKGWTPLWHAVTERSKEYSKYDLLHLPTLIELPIQPHSMEMLLEYGADLESINQNGQTLLQYAAATGDHITAQMVLDAGARIDSADAKSQTPLLMAAKNGHELAVRRLLEKSARVNIADNDGRTPLSWASENGHEAIVHLFLTCWADTKLADKLGWTPLRYAIQQRHDSVIDLLVTKGEITWVDLDQSSILQHAIATCRKSTLSLLLERGADIDAKDKQGQTVLLWAVRKKRQDIVRLLLESPANIECEDCNRQTPLSWSARKGYGDITQLLLDNHAFIETIDEQGRTPLIWAAWKGQTNIVRLLIENGADIDCMDQQGRTPLWYALWAGHEAVAQLLLGEGASSELVDQDGFMAREFAIGTGCQAIARLLPKRT